jgi:uncharacterized membrane protein
MSTTPPDEPTGNPGSNPPPPGPDYGNPPPSGPDYGAPPPSGPDYGYGTPPPPGGYGTPPPGSPYGAPPPPPGGGYGVTGDDWSVGSALGYGWRKFTQNLGPILVLALIVWVGIIVFGILGAIIDRSVSDGSGLWAQQLSSAITSLLSTFIQAILGAAVVRAALDLTEGRSIDVGSIFSRIPFGPVLILAILTAVIEAVGFLLCILPGLVALLFLYFSTYFLLDRNLSPVDAMKASVDLVRRNLGTALVWSIVAFVVTLVGVCLCFVGLLVTIPVATIGTAYTFKKLTGQPVAA